MSATEPGGKGGPNRRQSPRYAKSLYLTVYNEKHQLMEGECSLVDVGFIGFCFRSAIALTPGEKISFRLTIPGKGQIPGYGTVRWIRPSEKEGVHLLGVKFEQVGWSYAQKLREYLQPHIKRTPMIWE